VCIRLIPVSRVRIPLSPPVIERCDGPEAGAAGKKWMREGENPPGSTNSPGTNLDSRRPTPWRIAWRGEVDGRAEQSLSLRQIKHDGRQRLTWRSSGHRCPPYGGPVGPPATIVRKPRQVRKEATVADDSGAGVWLAGPPPFCFGIRSCSHDLPRVTWHNRG